jgi:hypothetical protein
MRARVPPTALEHVRRAHTVRRVLVKRRARHTHAAELLGLQIVVLAALVTLWWAVAAVSVDLSGLESVVRETGFVRSHNTVRQLVGHVPVQTK